MRKLFVIVSMLTIAVLLSGCTVCNINSGLNMDTFTLDSNTYKQENMTLVKDKLLNYSVSSTDVPVKIYILDESSYDQYKVNSGGWQALLTDTANMKTEGTFKSPKNDTYYFVVENDGNRSTTVSWNLRW